jgi:hypothetical protein
VEQHQLEGLGCLLADLYLTQIPLRQLNIWLLVAAVAAERMKAVVRAVVVLEPRLVMSLLQDQSQ